MPLDRKFGQRKQIPFWEDCGVVDDGLTELEAYRIYMSSRRPDPKDDRDLGVDSMADFDALSPEDQEYILQGEIDPETFKYLLELIDPHLTLD
jgi:hypothetical protein